MLLAALDEMRAIDRMVSDIDRLTRIRLRSVDHDVSNRHKQMERSSINPYLDDFRPSNFGIDKFHVTFPIEELPRLRKNIGETWQIQRDGITTEKSHLRLGFGERSVDLHLSQRPGRSARCALDFNPARFVDPSGIKCCRFADLIDVLVMVLDMISSLVEPVVSIENMKPRRIDIARNFYNVSNPGRFLVGLAEIPRPHATLNRLDRSSGGVPETVTAGSRSGGAVVLYDKHRQCPERTRPGTLRVEVQSRVPWLGRYGGITTVADITAASLTRIARNRFRWFGVENTIMGVEMAIQRILDSEQLDARLKCNLGKYVLSLVLGQELDVSERALQRYRRILRQLGIAPVFDSAIDTSITRLDLKSGREIEIA